MTKLLCFILLIPTLSIGQKINSTEKGDYSNVYNDAIKRFVRFISIGKSSFNMIYIQKDDFLTNNLSNSLERTRVQYMDIAKIEQKVMLDTSFVLYRIYPLSMYKDKFFVNVVPFSVSRDTGELVFKNLGAFKISYSFDCSKAQLRYKEIVAIDY